jgi:hypothetical protein
MMGFFYFWREKMGTVKKKQISIRLSSELLEQVDKLAKRECRTMANMIEWLLREGIRCLEERDECGSGVRR